MPNRHINSSPKATEQLSPVRPGSSKHLCWLLWAALIALYLVWPLTHLETYGWSNDEGLYLQRAALANAGYSLYSEAAFNKPPLLIWILQLAFKIGGQTITTGRLTILTLTLMGFVAFGKLAQQLWGRWAGLLSAGLLLALPEIPVRAHVVTSDLPAVSLATVALWSLVAFRCHGRLPHLILAALTITGALLIHPLLIYMAAPLTLVLLWPTVSLPACSPNKPITKKEFILFAAISLTFLFLTLLAIDWRAFFQWVFTANMAIAQNDTTLAANWQWISTTLITNWPLLWLAVVGSLALYATPQRSNLLIMLIWFLAAIAIFLVWSPLWEHYRLLLTLPLLLAAGGGLATMGEWLMNRGVFRQRPLPLILTSLALSGLILFCVNRWQATRPYLITGDREWTADHLAAEAFLRHETTATAFVTTDDPLLAFAAGRLVPPALTEATLKMIHTGFFSLGDAIEATLLYRAQSVILATGRLELLPGFEDWLTAVASQRHNFGSIRAYTLPPTITPAQTLQAQLGEALTLQGFTLMADTWQPGEALHLILFWQRDGPVNHDYHVFIHIVDSNDQIVAQLDGPPISQDYPTRAWAEGLLLPDPRVIEIGADVPPGPYRLMVGMYEWPSLIRLPTFRADGSRWPDDRIFLSELTLPP